MNCWMDQEPVLRINGVATAKIWRYPNSEPHLFLNLVSISYDPFLPGLEILNNLGNAIKEIAIHLPVGKYLSLPGMSKYLASI